MSASALDPTATISASGFEDGFGRRALGFDREDGVILERLYLRAEFAAYEAALHDAAAQVALCNDERIAKCKGTERDELTGELVMISEFVAGERISDLLDAAYDQSRDGATVPGIDVALGFLLDVLPALAALRARTGQAHGAVGPARTVLTPEGRVVLLECGFAAVLQRLRFDRRRLWNEFRIAMPPSAGAPRFDATGDIAQAALTAAMLVTGRPPRVDDDLDALPALLTEVVEVAQIRGSADFAVGLQQFLHRALHLAGRHPYETLESAYTDVRQLVAEISGDDCRSALAEYFRQMSGEAVREDVVAFSSAVAESENVLQEAEAALDEPEESSVSVPILEPQAVEVAAPPRDDVADVVIPAALEKPPKESFSARRKRLRPGRGLRDTLRSIVHPAKPDPPPPAPPAAELSAAPVQVAQPKPAAGTPMEPAVASTAAPRTAEPLVSSNVVHLAFDPSVFDSRRQPPPAVAPHPSIPVGPPPAPAPSPAAPPQAQSFQPLAPPSLPVPVPPAPAFRQPLVPVVTPPPAWDPPAPIPLTPVAAPPVATVHAPVPPKTIALKQPAPLRLKAEPRHAYGARTPRHEPAPTSHQNYALTNPATVTSGRRSILWKAAAAAAAAIIVAGIVVSRVQMPERTSVVAEAATPPAAISETKPAASTGALRVQTEPAGVRVLLDGDDAGISPVTLEAVAAGRHVLTFVTTAGSVKRTVRVEAGKTLSLEVPVYSGWVAIFSPIFLEVLEDGVSIGSTEQGRLLLSPGRHELTVRNRQLGYNATHVVNVEPGQERRLSIEPRGTVNLNAVPWAEVWIDGNMIGETPLANLPIPLGSHEIVFKHPQLGERRVSTTVTGEAPLAISVDFTKLPGQ